MNTLLLLLLLGGGEELAPEESIPASFTVITYVMEYDEYGRLINLRMLYQEVPKAEWVKKHGPVTVIDLHQYRLRRNVFFFEVKLVTLTI